MMPRLVCLFDFSLNSFYLRVLQLREFSGIASPIVRSSLFAPYVFLTWAFTRGRKVSESVWFLVLFYEVNSVASKATLETGRASLVSIPTQDLSSIQLGHPVSNFTRQSPLIPFSSRQPVMKVEGFEGGNSSNEQRQCSKPKRPARGSQ